jgi:ATP-dependent phosphofructokinase / diphosphate-dependent phosphofructokinase
LTKRVLVVTGGGDCPGLNAVIRGIVKRASQDTSWQVLGSIESYNGVFKDPSELKELTNKSVRGIHVLGGTILLTTNRGNPQKWPKTNSDGKVEIVDRTQELVDRLRSLAIDAVISVGGEGSHKMSQRLYELGVNIIAVPKTIDNDLSGTDFTFGFHTAVQTATDCLDKLVTTTESHNRVMIMEVMGRDAGWIALYSAIAGGAEVCLIPEIAYNPEKIKNHVEKRFVDGKGFGIIVIAEGARPVLGGASIIDSDQKINYIRLGGAAQRLAAQLKSVGLQAEIREMVLGHLQRGGTPVAFDRVLATQFGVKAFEMVLNGEFGRMVSYRSAEIVSVDIAEAIAVYRTIASDNSLVKTAKSLGICFG